MDAESLKGSVVVEIESRCQQLRELSLKIHSSPELAFKELKAAACLTEYLEENGFSVERGICELSTAFRASYGNGEPVIAVLAEYDALPELGHACGHNLIAASAVGAGVASRLAVDVFGGTVQVIGTPGEEMYGGKVVMAEKGAFNGVDAAMLVHPGVANACIIKPLASHGLKVEFFGRAAHAAARPAEGINALEAMIQSFNSINSLRQHVRDKSRIHGIITDGGEAANVIPAHSAGVFMVRAENDACLSELEERVINCFKGAATATGARLEYRWGKVHYSSMLNNFTLAGIFMRNMRSLGRKMRRGNFSGGIGSTDMGNVSQVVPAIHPIVAIASPGVSIHSPEFVSAAASEDGLRGLLDAAKAMAMTVVDLLADKEIVVRAREEFLRGE